jgi:Response regulator containing CheY-like receiver and SARP domains
LIEAQHIKQIAHRDSLLQIYCLGEFRVLRPGEQQAIGAASRHKMWLLFKYLVAHKGSAIRTEKIIEILWPGSSDPSDTATLRTTISRLKSLLEPHRSGYQRSSYVIYSKDSCVFNSHAPFWLDTDEFESLCAAARRLGENNRSRAIGLYLEALDLYQGDFLTEDPDLDWAVIPREHYRRIFIDSLLEVAAWFLENREYSKACTLLRRSIQIDPYVEELQILLMKTLLGMGNLKAAAEHYSYCSSFLYKELGVKPSAEWKSLYKQMRDPEQQSTGMRIMEGNIEEMAADCGPLVCEADFFWNFILFERRRLSRFGGESSLAVLELVYDNPGDANKTVADDMNELESIVYHRLRICDITCRLDARHLAILLPYTGVEGGRMIMQQVKEMFRQKINRSQPSLQFKIKKAIPLA